MTGMRNRSLLLALALVVVALGTAAAGAAVQAGAKTVKVTAREYRISLSVRKLPAGAVTLVVHNAGKVAHRIEIKGPGVTKETPLLTPGRTARLHLTLKGGTYSLWCTVPGHAALGMKASLTATAAGSSSGGGDNAWG
jgi:uncharacterized cupredoxin-like copper-binding protein